MNLSEKWDFDWNELGAILDGESMIDMTKLKNFSWEDATEYLYRYGYDMKNFEHRRKLDAVRIESWYFIQATIMPKEWSRGITPLKNLIKAHDARTILLMASDVSEENYEKRVWACALLRVMHTIYVLMVLYCGGGGRSGWGQMMKRWWSSRWCGRWRLYVGVCGECSKSPSLRLTIKLYIAIST